MTVIRPWALWVSGFLGAVGVVHAVPLFIRHDLIIAGVQLSTTTTLIATLVCLVGSATTWKASKS